MREVESVTDINSVRETVDREHRYPNSSISQ